MGFINTYCPQNIILLTSFLLLGIILRKQLHNTFAAEIVITIGNCYAVLYFIQWGFASFAGIKPLTNRCIFSVR